MQSVADGSGRATGRGTGPAEVALDCHEGICDPRTGCLRWPEHLRLLNETTGELVMGRCKATNQCRYCQQQYVLETVEMLLLDAAEYAPTLYVVLTAREHLTRKDTYHHLRQLRRAARKRWPAIEWFVTIEFQRRGALHLNLLIKGVPVEDDDELLQLLSDRWCARVDAEPVGQWVGRITAAETLAKYLAKHLSHGLKAEQAPPLGWKGHRTSQTRGYFVRPAAIMREEARAARRRKRALRAAMKAGERGHDVELVVHQALELEAASSWRLYTLSRAALAPGQAAAASERERGAETTSARRAVVSSLAVTGCPPSLAKNVLVAAYGPTVTQAEPSTGGADADGNADLDLTPSSHLRPGGCQTARGAPSIERSAPDGHSQAAQTALPPPAALVRRPSRRSSAALSPAVERSGKPVAEPLPGGGLRAGP